MTDCCRKCLKIFCKNRGEIENCENCVSEVSSQFVLLRNMVEEKYEDDGKK